MSLQLDNLSVRRGGQTVLDGLNLPPLPAGSLTALIGPNGAGKSTLIHALAGLLPFQGEASLQGVSLRQLAPAERARRVGLLPQTLPQGSGLSVYEFLLVGLRAAGASAREAEQASEAMLVELGLLPLALKRMDTLSGGQRQMVALAQALARRPGLLLLDEPNSALDLHWQLTMLDAVQRVVAERQAVALLALHDLNLALRSCARVIVLAGGRCRADGPPQQVLSPSLLAEVYGVLGRIEHSSRGEALFVLERLPS